MLSLIGGHVYFSADTGRTWQSNKDTYLRNMEHGVVSNGNIYALDRAGVLCSSNLGQSWDTVLGRGITGTALFIQDSLIIAGTKDHGILRAEASSDRVRWADLGNSLEL